MVPNSALPSGHARCIEQAVCLKARVLPSMLISNMACHSGNEEVLLVLFAGFGHPDECYAGHTHA